MADDVRNGHELFPGDAPQNTANQSDADVARNAPGNGSLDTAP